MAEFTKEQLLESKAHYESLLASKSKYLEIVINLYAEIVSYREQVAAIDAKLKELESDKTGH